jgi:hypothetical protein
MNASDLAKSFGIVLRELPGYLTLEERGNFLLAYSGRSRNGERRNVEELGAYVAISAELQPRKAGLLDIAAKFVRSCTPKAQPMVARASVGGRAAVVVEWADGAWQCAAWFVPATRGKVLIVEALVDPGRHPALPARGFGNQLVELIEWLPSTRDPRAVPAASVIRKSVGVASKRDFVLSFSPDTPDEVILREAKEAGIGLSRAYLQAVRNPPPPGPKARRGLGPASKQDGSRAPRPRSIPAGGADTPLHKPRSLIDRLRDMLKEPS